jgi:hypothetical protein
MANGTWPRMGSLNSVTIDDTITEDIHIYECSEDLLPFPILNATEPVECGCFNCAQGFDFILIILYAIHNISIKRAPDK